MSLELAEQILLDKFRSEPFHNLYLLSNMQPDNFESGGTCSDKTLSYLRAARKAGLSAHLHTARIAGKEIHRLIRLEIKGRRYFADVGNGWPSIKLFPALRPITYKCYGMGYRSSIEDGVITIYHRKRGVEMIQMEIDIPEKDEGKIYQSISSRFTSGIKYPFSNQLRFSMVIGKRFLFLRDTRLEIYSSDGYEEIPDINIRNLREIILTYFGYDIDSIIPYFGEKSFIESDKP